MILICYFIVALFITAYGNAMSSLVHRRQRLVDEGVDAVVPSKTYQWAARVLFWGGVLLLSGLTAAVVLGVTLPFTG